MNSRPQTCHHPASFACHLPAWTCACLLPWFCPTPVGWCCVLLSRFPDSRIVDSYRFTFSFFLDRPMDTLHTPTLIMHTTPYTFSQFHAYYAGGGGCALLPAPPDCHLPPLLPAAPFLHAYYCLMCHVSLWREWRRRAALTRGAVHCFYHAARSLPCYSA